MERLRLPRSLSPLTPARLRLLDNYLHHYRDLFPRSDQWRRFKGYLRGLLNGPGPKHMKGIASRLADGGDGDQTAQALQHFVTSSPWDTDAVLARYRSLVLRKGTSSGIAVVHDVIIPKKGRHSVGAQRQHARDLGRKINCQVAVAISQVGQESGVGGFLPLALRLYLPGGWLREQQQTAERTVPEAERQHLSREAIAASLLSTLFEEGWEWEWIAARGSYLDSEALRTTVARCGSRLPRKTEAARVEHCLAEANRGFEWLKTCLGLDQFEGRSWRGWHHHASLVLAACGFLILGQRSGALLRPAVPSEEPRSRLAVPAVAEAVSPGP
jgi:SRSO17 transposase